MAGHFLLPVEQTVLVEAPADARRIDHHSKLFFGRTASPVAPGQPRFLWPVAKADQTIEPDSVRIDHTLLHRYRVGYQTVGQPRFLWPATKVDQSIEPDADRIGYSSRLFFNRTAQAAAAVSQPFWMWPATKVIEVEFEPERRTDHNLLHRYRVGYQTVGQPRFLWPAVKVDQSVEPDADRIDYAPRLFFNRKRGPRSFEIGLVTETDTAFPVGRLKSRVIGLVIEGDTAFAVGRTKSRALGLITEIDTAFPVTSTGGAQATGSADKRLRRWALRLRLSLGGR